MGEIRKTRPKPELIILNNRQVCSTGHWNTDLAIEYIMEHGVDAWIPVKDLAHLMHHQVTKATKKNVRRNLSKTFKGILNRYERFMITKTGDQGRAVEYVKIWDGSDTGEEWTALDAKITWMEKRQELSRVECEQARRLLHAIHAKAASTAQPESVSSSPLLGFVREPRRVMMSELPRAEFDQFWELCSCYKRAWWKDRSLPFTADWRSTEDRNVSAEAVIMLGRFDVWTKLQPPPEGTTWPDRKKFLEDLAYGKKES